MGRADERALWEAHAAWWQGGLHRGADPEYEEQILPLAVAHLAGADRVLDVGCGEGQIARLAAALGRRRRSASTRPPRRSPRRFGEVAVPATGAPARGRCRFAAGAFDAVVACLVFEHVREVDAAIAEVARVLRPGGRFLFFLNHPLLQTPNSGWIDDQILDPPEQYWRIGAYLVEDETIEEVEKGVFIPFIHRPLSQVPERPRRRRADAPPHGRARPSTRVPGPCGRVRSGGNHPAPPLPPLREAGNRMSEFVIITGLSGAGRSQAADDLEDLGWFVIDNLPTELIPKVVELVRAPRSETPGWPWSWAPAPATPS